MMILGDISAEELFNMFFGAGFQTGICCLFFLSVHYFANYFILLRRRLQSCDLWLL